MEIMSEIVGLISLSVIGITGIICTTIKRIMLQKDKNYWDNYDLFCKYHCFENLEELDKVEEREEN